VAVDEHLTGRRAAQPGFVEPSFPTIAGAGANGAIIHYRAQPGSCAAVDGGTLLLVDSGAPRPAAPGARGRCACAQGGRRSRGASGSASAQHDLSDAQYDVSDDTQPCALERAPTGMRACR